MSPDDRVVIEIYGEGKADVRHDPTPQPPNRGVVPILVHKLCDHPTRMFVKCYGVPHLQQKGTGKGLWQKVRFARRQARYNGANGVVYVRDSEGDLRIRDAELKKGRDSGPQDTPMAVGVAHPCIESWLLSDAQAIQQGTGLSDVPVVPDRPEELPAPCRDRNKNPKTELAKIVGAGRKETSAKEKDAIARNMNDMDLVRTSCPLGFAPFADEVEWHIRPLF